MLRILHVVGNMDFGGVETLLMSLYRNIDRTKVQLDFLCHNNIEGKFDAEIRELGGRIYRIPGIRKSGLLVYKKNLYELLSQELKYTVIHSHLNEVNGIVLEQAKKSGITYRISHSHTANPRFSMLQMLLRKYSIRKIPKNTTHSFACSKQAANYLYRKSELLKKCQIMNNAINTEKFIYRSDLNEYYREKYYLNDKIVFGHVGSFTNPKNHLFLIDVFNELNVDSGDSKLLLIGTGPLTSKVKEYVEKKGLTKDVLFLGAQPDISGLMSAMDAFLFPSIYEGLGIVAIEAQASGLPVFASTKVPKETSLTDLITYISLEEGSTIWAEIIIKDLKRFCGSERTKYASYIEKNGYDIKNTAKGLQMFYLNLHKEGNIGL